MNIILPILIILVVIIALFFAYIEGFIHGAKTALNNINLFVRLPKERSPDETKLDAPGNDEAPRTDDRA